MLIKKKIKILSEVRLSYFARLQEKFLILTNSVGLTKYVEVPSNIFISKTSGSLFVTSSLCNFISARLLLRLLSVEMLNLQSPYYVKLVLKGLGYKLRKENLDGRSSLEFKLGLSHLTHIQVPSSLKITISKNKLIVVGYDRTEVGNFANRVRSFKTPDVYKGKGFWYAGERRLAKEIKKT